MAIMVRGMEHTVSEAKATLVWRPPMAPEKPRITLELTQENVEICSYREAFTSFASGSAYSSAWSAQFVPAAEIHWLWPPGNPASNDG